MSKWMEKELSTVEGIEELGYPKHVTNCLIGLFGSLDGILNKEQLPKIVEVESLWAFIKGVENSIRAAESGETENCWQISILPAGAPKECEITIHRYDAQALLRELFGSMCATDRCVHVATGYSSPNFSECRFGKKCADRCVVYVFKDRINMLTDEDVPTGPKFDWARYMFDEQSLPFSETCRTNSAIETLNRYVTKCGKYSSKDAIFDELIKMIKPASGWAARIRAVDLQKLLNDEELAKSFVNACNVINRCACPVYLDRARSTIDEAVEALISVYSCYGADNPEGGASNIIHNYYLLPSVDVCATFDNDYDDLGDIVGFVPTMIVDVADPNFIDNVLELAKIVSAIDDNYAELREELEGEVMISLERLRERIYTCLDEFVDEEEDD